jgi:hypothetical protein
MSKREKKLLLHNFTASYHPTEDSSAWKTMSPGGRCFFLLGKRLYNRNTEEAVYISARLAAERLGANKETVVRWQRECVHYGFMRIVKRGYLGAEWGPGRATVLQLTDERYLGRPPTNDFLKWDGTV